MPRGGDDIGDLEDLLNEDALLVGNSFIDLYYEGDRVKISPAVLEGLKTNSQGMLYCPDNGQIVGERDFLIPPADAERERERILAAGNLWLNPLSGNFEDEYGAVTVPSEGSFPYLEDLSSESGKSSVQRLNISLARRVEFPYDEFVLQKLLFARYNGSPPEMPDARFYDIDIYREHGGDNIFLGEIKSALLVSGDRAAPRRGVYQAKIYEKHLEGREEPVFALDVYPPSASQTIFHKYKQEQHPIFQGSFDSAQAAARYFESHGINMVRKREAFILDDLDKKNIARKMSQTKIRELENENLDLKRITFDSNVRAKGRISLGSLLRDTDLVIDDYERSGRRAYRSGSIDVGNIDIEDVGQGRRIIFISVYSNEEMARVRYDGKGQKKIEIFNSEEAIVVDSQGNVLDRKKTPISPSDMLSVSAEAESRAKARREMLLPFII